MPQNPQLLMAAMTGVSLNLLEDLPNSLSDLAKANGQTASYLATGVLRDYIEHEKMLTTQIK
jgi:predicted transcriptional regulator